MTDPTPKTSDAVRDVVAERARQVELGWTPEHDDKAGAGHLVIESRHYLNYFGNTGKGYKLSLQRRWLVKAAALLIAGIEVLDRKMQAAAEERRAPVQGHRDSDGTVQEPGTITWSEHLEAWKVYDSKYHGQTAERIAERGGFGLNELKMFLGHPPTTFIAEAKK